MPRRLTPSQFRQQMRQLQQRQQRAVNDYNRAVDNYNRSARAHNSRVRSNRQRLQTELNRLSRSTTTTTTHVTYRRSVVTLRQRFDQIESSAVAGTFLGGGDLFDLSEGETANSVAVLNALDGTAVSTEAEADELQESSIAAELTDISTELHDRWAGALYALSPRNPDASRHFCTSSRELLTTILETEAPDAVVLADDPQAACTPEGRVTRRARIEFCLARRGTLDGDLVAFIDDDIENVITLFTDFNAGTHGHAGRFDLAQLRAMKRRVEDAVRFLYRVVR